MINQNSVQLLMIDDSSGRRRSTSGKVCGKVFLTHPQHTDRACLYRTGPTLGKRTLAYALSDTQAHVIARPLESVSAPVAPEANPAAQSDRTLPRTRRQVGWLYFTLAE